MKPARSVASWFFDLLPLAIFFAYAVTLIVTFHGREIAMLDYTPTFDHWWYFTHRLREGALAQWNPYSLLGRIAVQWQYLPVSIFTPLMLLSELTLARFQALHVLGTSLVLIAVYGAGRIAGYGQPLSLLGIVLVTSTGFRYWMAFLHFATLLIVFPLLVAWLVSRADRRAPLNARETAGLGLGLAVAFLGLRLELMIYAVALVLLAFLALAWVGDREGGPARWIGPGAVIVLLGLAASAWQLAFLVASTLESQRGALVISLGRLLDGELARWLLASVLLQPLLLLMLLNLALAGVYRRAAAWSRGPLPVSGLVALLALEGGAAWALDRLGRLLAASLVPALGPADLVGGLDVAFSPAGLAAVALAVLAVRRAGPAITLPRALAAAAALSAGFAVSTYSGRTWIVNTSVHPYFVPLPLTGLLALGSVGLWLRGRAWVVATLTAYRVIGEVGALPLYESLGLPWFPPRASLVELPFQLMLMLEAARAIGGLLAAGLERAGAATIRRSGMAARLAGLVALVVAAILLHHSLLPTALAEDPGGFPFGAPAREVALPNGSLEQWTAGPAGHLVPAGCEYHPAAGASLARVTRAADGRVAAALLPSGRADSWLRCDVADVVALRGQYVRLSAAVRSEASYAGAVQLDVQDGTGPIAFERSDIRPAGPVAPTGWTRRGVVMRVHRKATRLFLTINATFAADGAVLVDDLRLEVAAAAPPLVRVYAEDFPFSRTPLDRAAGGTTTWVRDALTAADALRRDPAGDADHFHRRQVPDDVLLLSPGEQYYRFLPAYSRRLNTAPLYASEIPASLVRIFRDLPEERGEPTFPRPAHPDMPPLLLAYKRGQLTRAGLLADAIPYPAEVALLPHLRGRPVARALLAEEGGKTPRAFLASRVAHFADDRRAEYTYLARRLEGGGALMDEITASDPAFPVELASPTAGTRATEALGTVAFTRDDPEHVALAVTAEHDGYLLLLDLWSPGWRATVDGRPAAIYRAYGAARFVRVPAGRHVVDFTYRVPGLSMAAAISAVTALIGLGVLAQRARRS